MLEALGSAVGELVGQVVVEVLCELGFYALFGDGIRPPRPALAALGYAGVGGALGAGSLWVFPHPFLDDPTLALANLVVTPLVAGGVMAGIGALRRRRGQPTIRLDSFAYGALFAAALVLVRWGFAA